MILRVLFSIWHDLLLNLRKAEQGECVCFRRFSNSSWGRWADVALWIALKRFLLEKVVPSEDPKLFRGIGV